MSPAVFNSWEEFSNENNRVYIKYKIISNEVNYIDNTYVAPRFKITPKFKK